MKIYHGHPSPNSIQRCREAAPSYTHGAEWSPLKMTPHDYPYIVDNGAYPAFQNGEEWDDKAFERRLDQLSDMPRDPDFVVLPDVVGDPVKTKHRSREWADRINYPTAFAAQDGISPENAVSFATGVDADHVFVGGSVRWKHRNASTFVTAAHDAGLKCHIGRPGDLVWVREIGADSCDTTSVVRSQAWWKLRQLEEQETLV